MSIASSPDCLFRPKDKSLQMLFPSVGEGNNFDEFFNEELYNSSQQEDSGESPDDLFSRQPYMGDYPRLPSLSGSMTQERSSPQPWRKGLWCLNQAQPTKLTVEKTRKIGTGTISTAHLVSNDNFAIRSSGSPAVSPTVNTTKRFATSPNAANYFHKAHAPVPISREATLSPSPMYAQLPIQAKMEQVETWQQDFQNFHLKMPQLSSTTLATSPSKPRYGMTARHINAAMMAQNAGIGTALTTYNGLPNLGDTDVDGRNVLDHSLHTGARMNTLSSPTNQNSVIMHSHHNHLQNPIWTAESLHSSNSSHQSYETMPVSSHSGQSAHSAHEMFGSQLQKWWSPPRGIGNFSWNLSSQDQYPSIVAPAPQRGPAPIVAQNLDQPSGLGIQYPELEQMDQAVLNDPHQLYPDFPSVINLPYSPPADMRPHGIPPVPPLPFRSSNAFTNPSPFATPRKQRRSPSRSPSPSLSPTNTSARTLRQRSPTRTDYQHSHRRRKSIHKSGPMRDSAGEPVATGSVRARSRSTSKIPRTPRTPKTPTVGFGAVDFVNFTPKDSAKLLSDVAPSGSSKTRARREAEAREKRKKLSEAALKAVSSAGGDVEAVKKAILT